MAFVFGDDDGLVSSEFVVYFLDVLVVVGDLEEELGFRGEGGEHAVFNVIDDLAKRVVFLEVDDDEWDSFDDEMGLEDLDLVCDDVR